jgi:photosystem II stability/assembly factor-like uncharacterized protein
MPPSHPVYPSPHLDRRLGHRPGRRRRPTARRLVLEALEDRALLATWVDFGPAPITNGQTPGQQPVSGRIVGLAPDPNDATHIYIAAAGGGVWETANGGTNWSARTDTQRTLFMGAIALAPSNPRIIYAGTGEANFSLDSYYGRGVLKSTDGGANWTLLPGDPGASFDRRAISKIVVHPTNPDIVYVAVAGPGVNGLSNNTGIWKSTDGGATWTNTTRTAINASDAFTDLVLDPTNPNTLYAAVGTIGGAAAANGVYKTTDGGTTWARSGDFPSGATDANIGRIALAISPTSPTTLYASIAKRTGTGVPMAGSLYQMLKTTNGGTNWNQLAGMAIPDYLNGQGWYDTTLIVDPADANIIYAGGGGSNDSPNFIGSQILKITTNAAVTITSIVDISGVPANRSGPHADHHAIAFDKNGRLLVGTDGGIWRLNDRTVTDPNAVAWTDLNGDLETIQFTGTALDPSNPQVAYGGSQDNGTEKYTGNRAWTRIEPGDGGFVRVDPLNTNTVYSERFGISLRRSDDGGMTSTVKTAGLVGNANFYVPYVLDPAAPERLLLGTDRVFESHDRGDSWTAISAPMTDGWTTSAPVDAVAPAPGRDSTIYATAGGQIFVTIDHGMSWTAGGIGRNDRFNDVIAEPVETTDFVAYAVSNRFDAGGNVGHVFRTTDRGQTWTDISGNLPDLPTWSISVDPGGSALTINDDTLYVGTDDGVYASTNQGAAWARLGDGLPRAQVRLVEWSFELGVVAAGTHGRGLWETSAGASPVFGPGDGIAFFPPGGALDATDVPPGSAAPIAAVDPTASSAGTSPGPFGGPIAAGGDPLIGAPVVIDPTALHDLAISLSSGDGGILSLAGRRKNAPLLLLG